MPAPPPAASPAAVRARNPFGLDDAPAAPAAPLAAATPRHLDLDWGELEGDRAGSQPAPAARAPAAEAPAVANARVVELEELDFEPLDAPDSSPAPQAIELPEMGLDEKLQLAPATEFIPHAAATGHAPEPAAPPMELDLEPLAAVPPEAPSAAAAPAAPAGDGGEALLRQALSQASREVIERIAWEVVPQLAETIIREQLERLVKERQR